MPDNTTIFSKIAEIVADNQTFAVLSHIRPDGDAIGSQAALGDTLKALGKTVHVINEDGCPDNLSFLEVSSLVRKPLDAPTPVDVLFALDTANHERLGEKAIAETENAALTINIDHHKSNPGYGDLNVIDPVSPATGQIVYQLIAKQNWPLSKAAAEALYAAISTDTGSFQYPNTTDSTLEIAASLIRAGVDVGKTNTLLYQNYPVRRIHLLTDLLNGLKLTGDNRVASWTMTMEHKDKWHLKPDDSEGLIDILRSIDTVIAAIFFEELRDGTIRISSRSKDPAVDVSAVCQAFGGGGHTLAAGARVKGGIKQVQDDFLKKLHETLP